MLSPLVSGQLMIKMTMMLAYKYICHNCDDLNGKSVV